MKWISTVRKRYQRNCADCNKKTCVEEVRSRVFMRRRRVVERPDPGGGVVRVEGDVFHARVLGGIRWIGGL